MYLLLRVCHHRQTHFLRRWCSFKPSYRFVCRSATSSLSGDTIVFLIKPKLTPVTLDRVHSRSSRRLSHSLLASAVGIFFPSGLTEMWVRKDWRVLVTGRHFEIAAKEELEEMLRCAARRLVSPSLRGAYSMLGMFWFPFSDILGQLIIVLKAWSDLFVKRLVARAYAYECMIGYIWD